MHTSQGSAEPLRAARRASPLPPPASSCEWWGGEGWGALHDRLCSETHANEPRHSSRRWVEDVSIVRCLSQDPPPLPPPHRFAGEGERRGPSFHLKMSACRSASAGTNGV